MQCLTKDLGKKKRGRVSPPSIFLLGFDEFYPRQENQIPSAWKASTFRNPATIVLNKPIFDCLRFGISNGKGFEDVLAFPVGNREAPLVFDWLVCGDD